MERENLRKSSVLWYFLFNVMMGLLIGPSVVGGAVKEMITVHNSPVKKRIVLIGASIGKAWNIEKLPERIHNPDVILEYVGSGTFDKGPQLADVLRRTELPHAVIFKECAAYFPGDMGVYKKSMETWVQECRVKGVVPVLTTVVPVTRLHSPKKFLIDIVKLRNPFKFGGPFQQKRWKAILEYNNRIRDYAKKQGLPLLDLEAALRYSEKDRHLQSRWARYDGLHLKLAAYKVLDGVLSSLLNGMRWEPASDRPSSE